MSQPEPEHIEHVLQEYARLLGQGDVEAIVALFAPDAVLRDPVTGPERAGREAIRGWFEKSMARNGGRIDMQLEGPVRVAGAFGAVALTATAGSGDTRLRIDTLDVMEFDSAGLVVRLDAYWGPSNVHQLS